MTTWMYGSCLDNAINENLNEAAHCQKLRDIRVLTIIWIKTLSLVRESKKKSKQSCESRSLAYAILANHLVRVDEAQNTGKQEISTQASSKQVNMSSSPSLYSASTRAGSISTASTQTLVESEKRSSISRAMDKIRSKVTGSERLPSDVSESEKAKAKEIEKQQRKEDYERLAMDYRIKYGLPGAGVWHI
ncbi:hypothetical protein AC579_9230 [Pseudocercospora musae]|uniref:Uncharacterized protein n=1 Tax=Pseudocercospora musae TaxID=113226 RepID=A0A139IAV4_9PEZI|nr:hypothetical protein AC579_9230 [Pseudocercospora musae]